jgi:molybdopterin molybdotransferase
VIDPPSIGLLASVGVDQVDVARHPHVAVLITGDEFIRKDDPGAPGRIFNSNDVMLAAALQREGVEASVAHAADQRVEIGLALTRTLESADVVITTGGASVGDHDLMALALADLGAKVHFHGVAQKPGKPMLFASATGRPVFALPGNPRAVMVLFWEYVLPFLRAMQGSNDPWLRADHLPINHAVTAKGERAEFRAAGVMNGRVTLLKDEGSHMLRSLSEANALAYLPAGRLTWKAGDAMEVHYLPR